MTERTIFATLGLFIIDEFSFSDDEGLPTKTVAPQGSLTFRVNCISFPHILYSLDRRWGDVRSYGRSNMVRHSNLDF
jgi:hypothetical protein